jgi:hypothetical protein
MQLFAAVAVLEKQSLTTGAVMLASFRTLDIPPNTPNRKRPPLFPAAASSILGVVNLTVTSRPVVWLFFEQFWFEFVPVFHGLQGRFAAQG